MKTLYAPDSFAALAAAARDYAIASPAAAFVVCVALVAIFATYAAKNL